MNTSSKSLLSVAMLAATVLIGGTCFEASAQRDPFEKPAWARKREPGAANGGSVKAGGSTPQTFGVPAIDQRIDYYKRLREDAVANSMPVPKVTSVLTLDELAVTGIFKTPRGYAAMVEATPIKLSYTIYPGDKFFDGQLVAVEENRLVFRKVTKVGSGKFVSSVENKALRKYTDRDMIQGTAPAAGDTAVKAEQPQPVAAADGATKVAVSAPVVSPLQEMEKNSPKDSPADKSAKKPTRVAKKKQ